MRERAYAQGRGRGVCRARQHVKRSKAGFQHDTKSNASAQPPRTSRRHARERMAWGGTSRTRSTKAMNGQRRGKEQRRDGGRRPKVQIAARSAHVGRGFAGPQRPRWKTSQKPRISRNSVASVPRATRLLVRLRAPRGRRSPAGSIKGAAQRKRNARQRGWLFCAKRIGQRATDSDFVQSQRWIGPFFLCSWPIRIHSAQRTKCTTHRYLRCALLRVGGARLCGQKSGTCSTTQHAACCMRQVSCCMLCFMLLVCSRLASANMRRWDGEAGLVDATTAVGARSAAVRAVHCEAQNTCMHNNGIRLRF